MHDFFRFPFIKIISSKRYSSLLGLSFQMKTEPINQDFICRIRYGDLLKDNGDILLCPVSNGFRPSNPLSRKILSLEGKQLQLMLENIKTDTIYCSQHVVFLPCRKLNYRGILFVEVDFYSEDREQINAERIAEALKFASDFKCKKLSCPRNFLYSKDRIVLGYDNLFYEMDKVIDKLRDSIKIDFIIEYVIKKDIRSFKDFSSSIKYYDFSTAELEYLPDCAQIFPWYRKKVKRINTVYYFSGKNAKLIRKILTSDSCNEKQLFRTFDKFRKIMGDYYETGMGRCNHGFAFFLLELCNEMPWNCNLIANLIREYYKKIGYEQGLDAFIFNERIGNKE